jgi:hypothetical protein
MLLQVFRFLVGAQSLRLEAQSLAGVGSRRVDIGEGVFQVQAFLYLLLIALVLLFNVDGDRAAQA